MSKEFTKIVCKECNKQGTDECRACLRLAFFKAGVATALLKVCDYVIEHEINVSLQEMLDEVNNNIF